MQAAHLRQAADQHAAALQAAAQQHAAQLAQANAAMQMRQQMEATQLEASQQFQQQQNMRKQQEDAQAQAQWEAEYGLRASEAARKHQAIQEYQSRIAAGEDPMKVILETGPAAGLSGMAEAAVIRAQNQKKPPTWQMIPGLPEGVQALQSSAGGIHVLPSQKSVPKFIPDVDEEGNPGQREVNSNRFYPAKSAADQTLAKAHLAELYANRIDKLHEANPMFDLSGTVDPAWPKLKQAQFKAAKSRLEGLQAKIDALEGVEQSPRGGAELSPPPADPKERKVGQTYAAPKGNFTWTESGWVPAGGASRQTQAAPAAATAPAGPPMISPPWPASEGEGAPNIPAPPQAPMEQAPTPIVPPQVIPPQAAAPAALPVRGKFVLRPDNDQYAAANVEGTNRNFIPKMDNQQLVDTAGKLGAANATYDQQSGKFRVWNDGDSPKQQKKFTRKQFEDYLVKLASEKQMVWQGE